MLLAVLPATSPRKPRCQSMLLRWRTTRLSIIDQRHCRVQHSTANVICMQIALCAPSPSEPEHRLPTRHRHYPHSARKPRGFVQSGFCEVALRPALLASPHHATSQNPQDSPHDAHDPMAITAAAPSAASRISSAWGLPPTLQ